MRRLPVRSSAGNQHCFFAFKRSKLQCFCCRLSRCPFGDKMTLRRPVIASVAGTYVVFIVQIAASMVLARLLTPSEMGVWGIAQAAILLSSTLRDFGAGDYLIRTGEIDARSIGRVFALMLCISLACASVLWLGRGAVAAYFAEPRLVGLIGIATLTYLLMPFGL